jgi:Flp pilus assembly protein TadB
VIVLTAVIGALTAFGIIVIARQLRPAPPRLDVALARIQPTSPMAMSALPESAWWERLADRLAERLAHQRGILALPRTDLALLDRTVQRFVMEKLALFIAGILIPTIVLSALAVTGTSMPWAVPVLASLLLAAGLSFLPDVRVRSEARRHRTDFRYAFSCYLQLVLLEREAGAALNAALEGPVTVAGAWPFRRVGAALDRARRGQRQPWRTLAELGEQIGVTDLVDLAHSAQIAGTEGAKMHGVLTAKVTAMRHEAAATTRAEANARTTAMWVPTSLLMLGFVVLVGFPFFSRLVGSG